MSANAVAQLAERTSSNQFSVLPEGQPGRTQAEIFIAKTFARHYAAQVTHFMPELVALLRNGHIEAAAGCRSAAEDALFLEQYLDAPIEARISQLAGHSTARANIVELGQLAASRPGAGIALMLRLAHHLSSRGHTWVVFTATAELRGIFVRLGLPLFALAKADPKRLGDQAAAWGSYYEQRPLVVCASLSEAAQRAAQAGGTGNGR
jgi:hypothetical protein